MKLQCSSMRLEWKEMCLFCEEQVNKTGSDDEVWVAMTLELKSNILKRCNMRNDEWSLDVKGRLESVIDLPAAWAIYHSTCLTWFNKNSEQVAEISNILGWHVDHAMLSAFNDLCEQLKRSCDKLYRLDELHEQMSSCDSIGHLMAGLAQKRCSTSTARTRLVI